MTSSELWQPDAMPAQLIARAAHILGRVVEARFRELGIGVAQIPVFIALQEGARRSQKELARFAGVEQPSMAQLLARMERDGLIRREPDPADGRSSLISLTEAAVARVAPARAILAQGNQEALAGFDDGDVEQLVVLLRRVIANVSDDGGWSPATSGRRTGQRRPKPSVNRR